jgi:hypothetical protein
MITLIHPCQNVIEKWNLLHLGRLWPNAQIIDQAGKDYHGKALSFISPLHHEHSNKV